VQHSGAATSRGPLFFKLKEKEMTDTSERLAIQRILSDLRYLPKEKADKIRAILKNST
jgi:hypothetical protein